MMQFHIPQMTVPKVVSSALGGALGWVIAEFKPMAPLASVAVLLIFVDVVVAYMLDRRVHKRYPEARSRPAKFTSYAFGKALKRSIPETLIIIGLAYLIHHYVSPYDGFPLDKVVATALCGMQALSILENYTSCRDENDKHWRILKALRRILLDKTERHLDITLDEFRELKEKKEGGANNG